MISGGYKKGTLSLSRQNDVEGKRFGKNASRKDTTQQKQPPEVFYNKRCCLKFCKIYRKTPVPESLF